MYKLVTYTNTGSVYKTKVYSTKPSRTSYTRLIDKWSLLYGAQLGFALIAY